MIFLYCFFQLSQLLLVDGLSGKEGKDHILGGTRENPVAQIFQLGLLNRLFGDQRSDDEARLLSFQSAAESQSFDYSRWYFSSNETHPGNMLPEQRLRSEHVPKYTPSMGIPLQKF